MPTRGPASALRLRQRRVRGVVVVTLAAAAIAGLIAADPADASRATSHGGPSAAALPAAHGTTVTGVLERLSVDGEVAGLPGHPTDTLATTVWIRSGSDHVQVPGSALQQIPAGAEVTVQLDPADRGSASAPGSARPVAESAQAAGPVRVLSSVKPTAPASAPTSGPQPVTVVMALPKGSREDTTTMAQLAATVTGVASFWSRQSTGKITFAISRRVGWTAFTHGCSDAWGLWDEVQTKIGFVPGARRHLVVYVPPGAGCPTGLGTVGSGVDAGGDVVIGASSVGLLAHELGHNLGLGHSNALKCIGVSDGVFSGSGYSGGCQRVEYGDWYDVMGISWDNLGTLSTAQAYRLGLLGPSSVRTVSASTRVSLNAVSEHAGLQSLRIHDPAGATYVVEYRPATGDDAWLDTAADWRGLRPGVLVRRVDPTDPTQTLLLDPTPQATAAEADDDWDVALASGKSLTTASGRVRILVEATSATTAVISVEVAGVRPSALASSGGRLVHGTQVTVGQATAF